MADQDPAALAPCPFCGGEAMLYGSHHPEWKLCRVACSECGSRGCNYNSRADAAAAWNRRAPDPAVLALTEERDALLSAVKRKHDDGYAWMEVAREREKERDALRALLIEMRDPWDFGRSEDLLNRVDAALRGKEKP